MMFYMVWPSVITRSGDLTASSVLDAKGSSQDSTAASHVAATCIHLSMEPYGGRACGGHESDPSLEEALLIRGAPIPEGVARGTPGGAVLDSGCLDAA